MVVGLAGGYCSGKDTAARVFERAGFTVIDVDEIGHEALAEKEREVTMEFGPRVHGPGGRVDRGALGRLVFSSPEKLARLERIVHPYMVERVRRSVQARRGDVLINAAILFKMGLDSMCTATVCVTAPLCLRILRAKKRDGLRLAEAFRRVYAQRGIRPKSHGSTVDTYYVRNWGTVRSLERSVRAVLGRIQRGKAS
jgi:dephospho-CoA kinase